MNVYIAAATERNGGEPVIEGFKRIAAGAGEKKHRLVADPQAADLILFVDAHMNGDWRQKTLAEHPLVRQFPDRCLVYDERDIPWPALPGLYVSMPRGNFDPARQRACAYYGLGTNQYESAESAIVDLLFSFVGGRTHRIRHAVLNLSHPRAIIEDTTGFCFWDAGREDYAQRKKRFAEIMARSKFVLCPRGQGTASIRLFETLRAGRVPVIISDQWMPVKGPDWIDGAIFVSEKEIAAIPRILEERERDYEALSAGSARIFRDWFAPNIIFDRMIDECALLLKERAHLRPIRKNRLFLHLTVREGLGKARRFLGNVRRNVTKGSSS